MAEVTQKVIEIKAKIEGEKTVKQLKDQIAELTHLMDTLDTESLEYHRTVDMLVDAQEELNTVMKAGKSQLSAQEGSYNALVNRMAALKKAQKAVTDEASRMRLGDEIRKINDQLKEIDANNGVYVRNVGNYENAIKSALKTPQQELKALRQQLAQLTEGTAEYNAVFTRMADLTHQVTEQQEMLKWSSADLGDILGNLAGVATSVAGGFSAFNALGGLLGMGENEDMEKAMLQAQRFIQLIQGLEQLEQLGDKIKGLWEGLKNFATNSSSAAVALTDFSNETKMAESAMIGASQATSTNAAITGQAAIATDELAAATNNLAAEEQKVMTVAEYRLMIGEKKLASLQAQREANMQLLNAEKAKENAEQDVIEKLTARIALDDKHIKREEKAIEVVKKQIALEKAEGKEMATVTVATQANTAATNAQSAANVAAAGTTTLWAKALGILKTALISTGIGAILVALGALLNLLGKGIGKLWDWISGTNKAAEQTEALKTAFDDLNESLERQEKVWERQEMLMDAQGKSYEEIYEARRKNLQAQLAETQALLATQRAIANDIGQRKLQKKKYDEFRETLDELVAKEKELKQTIDDLDYKNYIDDIKAKKKAEEEAAAAAKKAAEQAKSNYNKQKEEADKLYKSLIEHYKTEEQKLKEKYEEEKKLLEKYGKDTTLLTKKYEEDKTAIVMKEAEARFKAMREYNNKINSLYEGEDLLKLKVEEAQENADIWNEYASNFDEFGGSIPLNVIEEFNKRFQLSMKNAKDFQLEMKLANKALEDSKKALADYQKQLKETASNEKVAEIEKQIEAISNLMEWESQQYQNAYDLYMAENNYYTDFTNNYISQMYLRWDVEDAIYQQRVARMQQEVDMYRAAAQDMTLTDEARMEALAKANAIERQIAQESADYMIAANTRKAEATDNYVAAVQDSLSGIGSILDNVASAWETSIQSQIDAGEISEEEGEKQMENMKGIQSAIALINALSSAVSAYNSMASIPYVGPALGAAAAAAALASGIAQVVAINKVKKGDKGGNESTRYAEVTPTTPDYNPTAVTNVTGGQETENLANAMSNTPIWVSVKDIDSAQSKVKTREKESTF